MEKYESPNKSAPELHNQIIDDVLFPHLIRRPIRAGGDIIDVLIVAESLLVGVVLYAAKKGMNAEQILGNIAEAANRRVMEKLPEIIQKGRPQ